MAMRFRKAERDDFMRAMDAFYERLWQAAQKGKDEPASLSLEPGNRWNPMIDAISTYINGCELKDMSTLDWDAYEDSELNWRVRRGYGALIAAYGAPCPVALNCNVTLIDHSNKRVRIETSQGTLTADKVIVTVPTNLIADEAIRFSPPLPAKVDAARGLPLGVDDKVTLALDDAEAFPKEGNLRGATMRTEMGTYHIRPFGQPCIEGFFGGSFARQLEDAGDGAIAAHSIDEIAGFLGNDIRRKLKPLYESRWGHDPFAQRVVFARAAGARRRPCGVGSAGGWAVVLRGRSDVAELSSRRRMGRGTAGSERRRKCWRLWASRNRTLPSLRAQRSNPESVRSGSPGLLRCARNDELLDHPCSQIGIRHEARIVLAKNAIAIVRDEAVDRIPQRFRHGEQRAHPAPARKMRQHRQRSVGLHKRPRRREPPHWCRDHRDQCRTCARALRHSPTGSA